MQPAHSVPMEDIDDPRFDLTDQVAVVTGGGTGIGAATAHLLARYGAETVLASRKIDNLERVAREITEASGRRSLAVQTDVRNDDDAVELMERTVTELGKIDILVNNAGGTYMFPLLDMPPERWDNAFDLNVRSAYVLTRAAGPHMLERGRGVVVNISSAAGVYGAINGAAYSAAKAALQMFTRVVAMEWGPGGVRANCIAVGMIASEGALRSWERGGFLEEGMARAGEPADIAYPVLFCASEASRFMNGQTIEVTGTPPIEQPRPSA
jgi:NAD(P)-dependent dehydrogenase (short-subunit alcohol dehydrogenase family)